MRSWHTGALLPPESYVPLVGYCFIYILGPWCTSLGIVLQGPWCTSLGITRSVMHISNYISELLDNKIVRHQVKYLGLMENLRVRRAGFCYRRQFQIFLQRYKCLCPDTWPLWEGNPRDGVNTLCKHLGYSQEQYKTGKWVITLQKSYNLLMVLSPC